MSLKLISLNIEQDKHLDRIIPFVVSQKPDVVLLQEVFDKDIHYLEKAFNMKGIFVPLNYLNKGSDELKLGIFTLSNLKIKKSSFHYYRGSLKELPHINDGEPEKMARAILVTEYIKNTKLYCLINTHFTWSANGQANEAQRIDLKILLELLDNVSEFIMCGDFNAPRGGEIFGVLAQKFKDNIPLEIKTTLDKDLHKVKNLNLVVDSVFTTSNYKIDSMKIKSQISDHCAIIAVANQVF